jgi:hypothetical protein
MISRWTIGLGLEYVAAQGSGTGTVVSFASVLSRGCGARELVPVLAPVTPESRILVRAQAASDQESTGGDQAAGISSREGGDGSTGGAQ